jgi:hypothetical protein
MPETQTGRAVQLLDLMLGFFAEEAHWMQGQYRDRQGRRCLVGAVLHFSSTHRLPRERVMSLLEAALPQRQLGLIHFNDHYCRNAAELRSVIDKARALALESEEHERAAAALRRRLLAEVECERTARAAAGGARKTYIICPRAPGDMATAPMRLAA